MLRFAFFPVGIIFTKTVVTVQRIQLGPLNVFPPIPRRAQNKRIRIAVAIGVKTHFWFERESTRRATRMCTSMPISTAKWHLFWSTARQANGKRLKLLANWRPVILKTKRSQCKICFTAWGPRSLNTKQTRQMRFVDWKPRMLRTKESQHENTSEWRGQKEGQSKIIISKTKISMQDFRDLLIGNH